MAQASNHYTSLRGGSGLWKPSGDGEDFFLGVFRFVARLVLFKKNPYALIYLQLTLYSVFKVLGQMSGVSSPHQSKERCLELLNFRSKPTSERFDPFNLCCQHARLGFSTY